jgi:hypothetical protein
MSPSFRPVNIETGHSPFDPQAGAENWAILAHQAPTINTSERLTFHNQSKYLSNSDGAFSLSSTH